MKTARSLVLAVAGAALVLAPVAAHAASTRQVDTRGDLQYISVDGEGNPTDVPPQVSAGTNGDVVATKVTYTSTYIGITTRFAGLAQSGFQDFVFEVHGGKYVRTVEVLAGKNVWHGVSHVTDGGGNEVAKKYCSPKHKIDYAADTVTVNIPSSCVKTPGSVTVGAGTQIVSGSKVYYDDAFRKLGTLDDPLKLTPAIARG